MQAKPKKSLLIFLIVSTLSVACLTAILCSELFTSANVELELAEKPVPKNSQAVWRLFLTGDTGNIRPLSLKLIEAQLKLDPSHSTLVLMGDNIYNAGITAENHKDRALSLERLTRQLNVFKKFKGTQIIFVPGNHDWDNSGPDGLNAIRRQQSIVEETLGQGSFFPRNGCPGPDLVELGSGIVSVLLFDSQWWLTTQYEKPNSAQDGCAAWDDQGVLKQLDKSLAAAKSPVVFVQHHPLYSTGPHSDPTRCNRGQDFGCARYQQMRQSLLEVLLRHAPLACASGHDHSLQVLRPDSACKTFLVSGSTTSFTSVRPDQSTLFAARKAGIMRIDFFADGKSVLQVIGESHKQDQGQLLFSVDL